MSEVSADGSAGFQGEIVGPESNAASSPPPIPDSRSPTPDQQPRGEVEPPIADAEDHAPPQLPDSAQNGEPRAKRKRRDKKEYDQLFEAIAHLVREHGAQHWKSATSLIEKAAKFLGVPPIPRNTVHRRFGGLQAILRRVELAASPVPGASSPPQASPRSDLGGLELHPPAEAAALPEGWGGERADADL
jgi:hypothetical protein